MNKQVVVLGMHRSGTSTVALILKELGVHMGDTTLGEGTGNPFGHEEDRDFFDLNCRILRKAGGSWDFPPAESMLDWVASQFEAEITGLILKKNMQCELWGWKEPRTSILFNYYNRCLPNAKIIHVVRDPILVAKSLEKRNRMPLKKGLRLCAEYKRRLEDSLQKVDGEYVFEIAFEDLQKNGRAVIADLISFLRIDVEEQAYENAVGVIKPKNVLNQRIQCVRRTGVKENSKKVFQHPLRALMFVVDYAVRFVRYRLER